MPNKSTQYRIVYRVTDEPFEASSVEKAKRRLNGRLDDLCSGAISNSNVTAVLQEHINIAYSDEPPMWVWNDIR